MELTRFAKLKHSHTAIETIIQEPIKLLNLKLLLVFFKNILTYFIATKLWPTH